MQAKISKRAAFDLKTFNVLFDGRKLFFYAAATVSDGIKNTVYVFASKQSKKFWGMYDVTPTIFIKDFKDKRTADLYHNTVENAISHQACHGPFRLRDFFGRIGAIHDFYDFVKKENAIVR